MRAKSKYSRAVPTPIVSPLCACISLQKCAASVWRITSGFAVAINWSFSSRTVRCNTPELSTESPSITTPKSPTFRSIISARPTTGKLVLSLIFPVKRFDGLPQRSSPLIDNRNASPGRRNVGRTAFQFARSPGTIEMVGFAALGSSMKS